MYYVVHSDLRICAVLKKLFVVKFVMQLFSAGCYSVFKKNHSDTENMKKTP